MKFCLLDAMTGKPAHSVTDADHDPGHVSYAGVFTHTTVTVYPGNFDRSTVCILRTMSSSPDFTFVTEPPRRGGGRS